LVSALDATILISTVICGTGLLTSFSKEAIEEASKIILFLSKI